MMTCSRAATGATISEARNGAATQKERLQRRCPSGVVAATKRSAHTPARLLWILKILLCGVLPRHDVL